MTVAIIDADLISRRNHRFPNLACEKISAYCKSRGKEVVLKLDYNNLDQYEDVFISKVFTDTEVPEFIQRIADRGFSNSKNIHIGGTGFFFDKAKPLKDIIEHQLPDYHLYDGWIEQQVMTAKLNSEKIGVEFNEERFRSYFHEYTDCSIGFLTRGCFRKCKFCVNQKYDRVFKHSELKEFYDPDRKSICLLDDNFFGYINWEEEFSKLEKTGKRFKFKQGLDERLLDSEKCKKLFKAKYDGDIIFAFDNVREYELIEKKLKLIRTHTNKKGIKFYVLVGFEGTDALDIENAFKRIALLMKYKCVPYLMRYQNKNVKPWKESKYATLYVAIARWCNQQNIFKKMSFRYFCEANQKLHKTRGTICATLKAMQNFEKDYPNIAKKYFDLCYSDF